MLVKSSKYWSSQIKVDGQFFKIIDFCCRGDLGATCQGISRPKVHLLLPTYFQAWVFKIGNCRSWSVFLCDWHYQTEMSSAPVHFSQCGPIINDMMGNPITDVIKILCDYICQLVSECGLKWPSSQPVSVSACTCVQQTLAYIKYCYKLFFARVHLAMIDML